MPDEIKDIDIEAEDQEDDQPDMEKFHFQRY